MEKKDSNFSADKIQTCVWIYQSTNGVPPFVLVSYGTKIAKPFWNVYLGRDGEILRFETGLLSERVSARTNRGEDELNDDERKSVDKK